MIKAFKATVAATALGLMAALPISAATITSVTNAPASWAGVDPAKSLDITGAWGTAPSIVSGSVANHYKSPFDPAGSGAPAGSELANWQNIQYWTIGSPGRIQSPAVMTFTAVQSYLSILWGSVDTYNAIRFFKNGAEVSIVSGQNVLDAGGTPSASGAALVKISASFDEIRMFSNYPGGTGDTPAFEFSHVVAAVPLPAGGLLLIGALGGLAFLRRRKAAA